MRFGKKASKMYNIQTLWQQSCDLDITSKINSLADLEQSKESLPINSESFTLFLSQIPCSCLSPFLQQQI